MFEKATDVIQKELPAGSPDRFVALFFALLIAWIIFMVIREFWCWFWKTTKIASELESINHTIDRARQIGLDCHEELKKAQATLERIAEGMSAKAGSKQDGSGGN